MPAADVLGAWAKIEDGFNFYRITADEWAPVATALGDDQLTELSVLASIEDEDFRAARDVVKLTPIKKGAFNMFFGAVKQKYGFVTNLVQQFGKWGHVDFDLWSPKHWCRGGKCTVTSRAESSGSDPDSTVGGQGETGHDNKPGY